MEDLKICTIEGCDDTLYVKGLCRIHYYRQYRLTYVKKPCKQLGCENLDTGGGYCPMHRYRDKHGLDMDAPLHRTSRAGDVRICKRDGCENIIIGRSSQFYCSITCRRKNSTWRKDNPIKANNTTRRRKALVRGAEATLTNEEWLSILDTFNYECVYCGDPWEQMDHFIPLFLGGTHTADNVVPACAPCNQRKNRQDPLKFIGCGSNAA